jgi:protein-tyrosine phosphatase
MSLYSDLFRSDRDLCHPQEVQSALVADLHCHLLPNWDDGSRSLEESFQMASRAAAHGVKQIVVTPHVGRAFGGRQEKAAHKIPSVVADLERKIHDRGIAVNLVSGAEIVLSLPNLEERLQCEPWLTIGGQGRYILAESPFDTWPKNAEQLLFRLSLLGITPIIAHPERLVDVQQNIDVMRRLVERGALLQVTAQSVFGSNHRRAQCCQKLLGAGLVALVASDAHNAKGLWPSEITTPLRELIGEEATHKILVKTPLSIIAGEPVKK